MRGDGHEPVPPGDGEHPTDRLDFVKCDTDGWEAHVLRGAEATLRRFRPALLLEINPRGLADQNESVSALLSLLAGDIFGRTPIWTSLRAFKAVYYAACLFNPRRSLQAMRTRAFNIRPADRDQPAAGAAAGG